MAVYLEKKRQFEMLPFCFSHLAIILIGFPFNYNCDFKINLAKTLIQFGKISIFYPCSPEILIYYCWLFCLNNHLYRLFTKVLVKFSRYFLQALYF